MSEASSSYSIAEDASSTQKRAGALGGNQVAVKDYNERLILQVIRQNGSLPNAEIARATHLSAQAVSVIINRLLDQGLVERGERIRVAGKIGQPSVPIALAPSGAYSIGIKIGRKSLDLVLMDFTGNAVDERSFVYDYPSVEAVMDGIKRMAVELSNVLPTTHRKRIVGAGVATPFSLDAWADELEAPQSELAAWKSFDPVTNLEPLLGLPVSLMNDASAACVAELVFGRGSEFKSYLYVFVGTFIGGGVVLDGRMYPGDSQNAGALGSFALTPGGEQLLNVASLIGIQRLGFEAWLPRAAEAIAHAVHNACAIIDFQAVIIDSGLLETERVQLFEAIRDASDASSFTGLRKPELVMGKVGSDARVLGGALLPLYDSFAPRREFTAAS